MTRAALHLSPRTSASVALELPRWADMMFANVDPRVSHNCEVRASDGATIASTTIDRAACLDAEALRESVADAYRRLFEALDAGAAAHVVRAWNFVPDLLAPMGDGGDRYMRFNAGRYDAMAERFGDAELARRVPAATGVGHAGEALTIHLLASSAPGVSIENPRQTPAYRYSARYGPLPPCFARATLATLPIGRRLLVAGTAAIRGESTLHASDFSAQLRLTVENLRAILAADGGGDALERFESLRAYVPPMADVDAVRRLLPDGVVEVTPVAALCRADLLIEIEGVAVAGDHTQEAR